MPLLLSFKARKYPRRPHRSLLIGCASALLLCYSAAPCHVGDDDDEDGDQDDETMLMKTMDVHIHIYLHKSMHPAVN